MEWIIPNPQHIIRFGVFTRCLLSHFLKVHQLFLRDILYQREGNRNLGTKFNFILDYIPCHSQWRPSLVRHCDFQVPAEGRHSLTIRLSIQPERLY